MHDRNSLDRNVRGQGWVADDNMKGGGFYNVVPEFCSVQAVAQFEVNATLIKY
jgi:hypothetical protein